MNWCVLNTTKCAFKLNVFAHRHVAKIGKKIASDAVPSISIQVYIEVRVTDMVINATFNYIYNYIVVVRFIDLGNRIIRRKPPTCNKSPTSFITQCCIEYSLLWAGFEHITLAREMHWFHKYSCVLIYLNRNIYITVLHNILRVGKVINTISESSKLIWRQNLLYPKIQ